MAIPLAQDCLSQLCQDQQSFPQEPHFSLDMVRHMLPTVLELVVEMPTEPRGEASLLNIRLHMRKLRSLPMLWN